MQNLSIAVRFVVVFCFALTLAIANEADRNQSVNDKAPRADQTFLPTDKPLSTGVRIALGTAGGFLLSMALFLYEDGEKKIQSHLEDTWLRVYAASETAISGHVRFMRAVASLANDVLTFLFGDRLFTSRAIAVSMGFSLALSSVCMAIEAVTMFENTNGGLLIDVWWILIYVAFVILFSLLTLLTVLKPRLAKLAIGICVLAFPVYIFCEGIYLDLTSNGDIDLAFNSYHTALETLSFTIVLLLAVTSDFAFIVLTRRLVWWAQGLETFAAIIGTVALNLVAALLFVAVPLLAGSLLDKADPPPGSLLDTVTIYTLLFGSLNLTVVAPASLFVILAFSMLLHRLLWPLVCRPIYVLQRVGIAQRRKMIAGVGIALCIFAIPGAKELLKQLVF